MSMLSLMLMYLVHVQFNLGSGRFELADKMCSVLSDGLQVSDLRCDLLLKAQLGLLGLVEILLDHILGHRHGLLVSDVPR